jgi:hypothetical protein
LLKAIFSSQARVKILNAFLLAEEGQEFFIRELTRILDEQINSIRRELENLKKIGFLKSKTKNRKKYYFINTDFIIYDELKSIFQKCSIADNDITKKLLRTGKIELLILSGIFVGKEGGIDIFLIGDIDRSKLNKYIAKELKFEREIRYSVFSAEEFFYRVECRDKFVTDILKGDKNIVVVNKLEKELKQYNFF